MTKTHKVTSDLLALLSKEISRAIEADKYETHQLRFLTSRILNESVKRKKTLVVAELVGYKIGCFLGKKNYEQFAAPCKKKVFRLEKSLDDATKRIQNANAKELFKVIEINMKHGPEEAIKYVLSPFPKEIKSKYIKCPKSAEGVLRNSQK